MKQRLFIASDHGGFLAKQKVCRELASEFDIVDLGPEFLTSDDDYPIYAAKVAQAVVTTPDSRGILLCRSGEGMEIAANKITGARAAIAWNKQVAIESRHDNDSNIVSVPADYLTQKEIIKIIRAWLAAEFSRAPRHIRRLAQISQLEHRRSVVPAILEQDLTDFQQKMKIACSLSERIQIDVVDGKFADNKTVELNQMELDHDYFFDLDMMVARPSDYFAQVMNLSPNLAIFHLEAEEPVVSYLHNYLRAGVRVGLALNPSTPVSELIPYLAEIDHAMVMGVNAGFSGQKFHPSVITKIEAIRQVQADIEIGLDGGINQSVLAKLTHTSLDVANINSGLFKTKDPSETYQKLSEVFA